MILNVLCSRSLQALGGFVVFDQKHTWDVFFDVPKHQPSLLKLPFSLHANSGRPAMVLPRGTETGLLETPWQWAAGVAATPERFQAAFIRSRECYFKWLGIPTPSSGKLMKAPPMIDVETILS